LPGCVLKLFDLAAQVFKTLRLDSHLHRAAVVARDPQRLQCPALDAIGDLGQRTSVA
jgi:hypothetical protein